MPSALATRQYLSEYIGLTGRPGIQGHYTPHTDEVNPNPSSRIGPFSICDVDDCSHIAAMHTKIIRYLLPRYYGHAFNCKGKIGCIYARHLVNGSRDSPDPPYIRDLFSVYLSGFVEEMKQGALYYSNVSKRYAGWYRKGLGPKPLVKNCKIFSFLW